MLSESSDAAAPSSHWISSARRPVTACQYVSATTATPAAQPAAHAPVVPVQGLGSRATTARTPGTALALVASYDLSVPPNTGQRSIEATSMAGAFTSIPNTALPSTLAGVSSRGRAGGGGGGGGRRAPPSPPRRRAAGPRFPRPPRAPAGCRRVGGAGAGGGGGGEGRARWSPPGAHPPKWT